MVGQHSENITMEDVDFEAPKESGRTTAGYADFVQMSGCKGAININNCTFAGPHDDPINIHGTFNCDHISLCHELDFVTFEKVRETSCFMMVVLYCDCSSVRTDGCNCVKCSVDIDRVVMRTCKGKYDHS